MSKNKTDYLVNPLQALQFVAHRPTDDMVIVSDLVEKFKANPPLYAADAEENSYIYNLLLWSCIWNAGRVQGIREIRIKRNIRKRGEHNA